MSLDQIKKSKILKENSDENVSVLKANKKRFKNVFVFSKYIKTFGYSPDCLIVQINAIEYYKLSALHLYSFYVRIA